MFSALFVHFSFVDSPSVLWYCWLGLLTCKNRLPYNLYCVGGDVKHYTINQSCRSASEIWCLDMSLAVRKAMLRSRLILKDFPPTVRFTVESFHQVCQTHTWRYPAVPTAIHIDRRHPVSTKTVGLIWLNLINLAWFDLIWLRSSSSDDACCQTAYCWTSHLPCRRRSQWNDLPADVTSAPSLLTFRKQQKLHLFDFRNLQVPPFSLNSIKLLWNTHAWLVV